MLENIAHIVRDLVGTQFLYIDIDIKLSAYSFPIRIKAICAGPAPYSIVYVMDGGNQWHLLTETAELKSLYTSLLSLQKITA